MTFNSCLVLFVRSGRFSSSGLVYYLTPDVTSTSQTKRRGDLVDEPTGRRACSSRKKRPVPSLGTESVSKPAAATRNETWVLIVTINSAELIGSVAASACLASGDYAPRLALTDPCGEASTRHITASTPGDLSVANGLGHGVASWCTITVIRPRAARFECSPPNAAADVPGSTIWRSPRPDASSCHFILSNTSPVTNERLPQPSLS